MSFTEKTVDGADVMLAVSSLTKSFGEVSVLKGISFSLNKGEVLAIIGSSGSGKTTLLRCLNYLEIPDGGKISVSGTEYFSIDSGVPKEAEIRERRLHMGLVFQSFNLFPQYTVKANLLLAAKLIEQEKLKKRLNNREIDKAQYKEEKARTAEMLIQKADSLLSRVTLELNFIM